MTETPPGWQYASRAHIVFGVGSLAKLPELVPWRSLLLVTTPGMRQRGTVERIQALLRDRTLTVYSGVAPEPQLPVLEDAANQLRGDTYEGIVAVGGGSSIDTAKAFSLLLGAESRPLRHYCADGATLPRSTTIPVVAVPTTAGTGAEVTPFATIWDDAGQRKHSLEVPGLCPQIALLDPELTLTAPRPLTLSTGLDALCQGLESLWSRAANPVATSLALRAVSICLRVLPSLLEDLDNLELRTSMMEASLLAGLAIASTKTTLSHSISYPLTLRLHVPHGLACAFTVAHVARFNAEGHAGRLREIAQALGFATPDLLADELEQLLRHTEALPWLARLLPSKLQLLDLAPLALTPGRAENNLRAATTTDVEAILSAAWHSLRAEPVPRLAPRHGH